MANTNAPFGFRQYSGNGSAPTYEQVAVSYRLQCHQHLLRRPRNSAV